MTWKNSGISKSDVNVDDENGQNADQSVDPVNEKHDCQTDQHLKTWIELVTKFISQVADLFEAAIVLKKLNKV